MMQVETNMESDWKNYNSLAAMVKGQAKTNANRLALVAQSANGNEERITYAQLVWQGEKFAQALLNIPNMHLSVRFLIRLLLNKIGRAHV